MIRRELLAVVGALVLSACSKQPPDIGRDLPITFGYTPAFTQRLNQRFPVGSEEQQLVTELRNERFTIKPSYDPSSHYQFSALYEVSDIVCRDEWTIQWAADQGKITAITGLNRRICL